MTRRAASLATMVMTGVLALSGCAFVDSKLDRDSYFAARDLAATFFTGNKEPPAPILDGVPGFAFTDLTSAHAAFYAASGEAPTSERDVAITFLTRVMADPAFLCGAGTPDPLADLVRPEDIDRFQTFQAGAGAPYLRFPTCDPAVIGDFGYDDMRITFLRLVSTYPIFGTSYFNRISFEAHVLYLFETGSGPVPFTSVRSGEFTVLYLPPYPVYGLQSWAGTSGFGLGAAGLPDPDVFAPTGESSVLETPDNQAASVVTVTTALGSTLSAESVELTRFTLIEPPGENPSAITSVASGILYPSLGSADLVIDSVAGPRGERVIDQDRVFVEGDAGLPSGQNPWREINGGAMPGLGEPSATGNVLAMLDWLSLLRSAGPIDCDDSLSGDRCFAVSTPIGRALTPGTPGYRSAIARVQLGATEILLAVGVRDGKLSSLRMDDVAGSPFVGPSRTRLTYQFTGYDVVPVPLEGVLAPPGFVA